MNKVEGLVIGVRFLRAARNDGKAHNKVAAGDPLGGIVFHDGFLPIARLDHNGWLVLPRPTGWGYKPTITRRFGFRVG